TSTAQFTITITVPSSDTTPPVIDPHANIKMNATSPAGVAVSYTVTASDPDNTAADITIVCSPASGSVFPLTAAGQTKTTTVTCNAHDPAGNNATPVTFTVTIFGVHDQLVALEGQVNAATNLSHSQKKSIASKLLDADAAFSGGDKAGAKSSINAFIKKVAQLTPPITSAQKTLWTGEANNIIAVIGS